MAEKSTLNPTEQKVRDAMVARLGARATLVSVSQSGDDVAIHVVASTNFSAVAEAIGEIAGSIAQQVEKNLSVTLASSWRPASERP